MSAADTRHPLRVVLATAAALLSGAMVALQSRINGQLSGELGDAFVTAFVSFGSGLVLLGAIVALLPAGRSGLVRLAHALRARDIPWWFLAGGAGGALFVLTQSLVVALVGVALFTVGVVAGQAASSLLIDRAGVGTMSPRPLTPLRVLGAVLALVAVIIAVSGQLRADVPLPVLIAPMLAGFAVGGQQAVNGQLREVAHSALTATFVSFLVGTAVLALAMAVHLVFAPWPAVFPANPLLYTGGLVGCVFIAVQAVAVRTTGVLLMGLAVLSGQVVAAAVLDLVLPVPGHEVGVATLAGAALTLVAVAVAGIRAPSRAPSR